MAKGTHYSPKEFAAAYIQTLPHAKDREEFNSNADYWEYLKNVVISFSISTLTQ